MGAGCLNLSEFTDLIPSASSVIEWSKALNDHSATVSIFLVTITLIIGWLTGFFARLSHKPEFRIRLLPGPSFFATYQTGRTYEGKPEHKSACSLYLEITNIGTANSSIADVQLSYKSNLFSSLYRREKFPHLTIIKDDFVVQLDADHSKLYPHLFQRDSINKAKSETFLLSGMSTNGVVYFESNAAWGGLRPRLKNNKTKMKISVFDTLGKRHELKTWIDKVELVDARNFNPSFGNSLSLPDQSN